MRIATTHLATIAIWLALLGMASHARSNDNATVDVDVSEASSVRIVPVDYDFPITRNGIEESLKKGLYPSVDSPVRKVGLTGKQALELHFDQTETPYLSLSCLSNIPDDKLRKLSLSFHLCKPEECEKLKRFTELKHLALDCVDVDIDAIIKACPQLESLELSSAYDVGKDRQQGDVFADATFEKVATLKNLQAFRTNAHHVSDQALVHLKKLTKLKCLEVITSELFTDNAIKTIAACPELVEVRITMNRSLTFEGLAPLADLPKLERLWLEDGEAFFTTAPKELQAKFKHVLIKTKP